MAGIVLDYIRVLIWPALVGGGLIGYRVTVKRLVSRLLHFSAGPVSATFDKIVQDATDLAIPVPPGLVSQRNPTPSYIRGTNFRDAGRLAKRIVPVGM